jgi:hypothetical protein
VGDPDHEWTELRWPFFHLRRRLTPEEAAPIGEPVDVRGTWEAEKRLGRVRKWLPPGYEEGPP